jgi:hypothetical protein
MNKFIKLMLTSLSLVFLLISCSRLQTRLPAAQSFDLKNLVNSMHQQLTQQVQSHEQCYINAENYYQQFYKLDSDKTQLTNLSTNDIIEITETTFNSKLLIRDAVVHLDLKNENGKNCYHAIRKLLRAIRYLEDYLIEFNGHGEPNINYTTLLGSAPYAMVNPKYQLSHFDQLQSGDVILSRGNAYTSAAIARIGEDDAQFSHISFVYKDPQGMLWTIEAHIEIGSVVEPIDVHINQKNARTVVFRYKDPSIAHKAAEYMFHRVGAKSRTGRNIPYDFGMDYQDNTQLFCSEVVSQGFMQVGQVDVPKYKTKFPSEILPFLQQLGIKVDQNNIDKFESFAPGDMEIDPRFDLVAEWRNPLLLKSSRTKDAILTKMFEWMGKENYQFYPQGKIARQSYMAWILRRAPFIKKKLQNKFPLNMSAKQLQLFLVLEQVAESIENEVTKYDVNKSSPLSPKQLFDLLENIKKRDFKQYKQDRKSSLFHHLFRPK